MKTESRRTAIPAVSWRPRFFILLLVAILSPLPAHACEDWVAKVIAVEGLVQRLSPAQDWQPLKHEQRLCPGDSVRVGGNSRAALHLRNNTFARLDANSILSFPTPASNEKFWIELKQGLAHFISRIVRQFEVATPYVNAVVEGTEFIVSAQEQGAVSVMEGKVTAYNEKSRARLTAGQQATASARDQDLSRFNVPPSTVVEWAIHYPPVLSLAELPAQTAQDKALIQDAITALQQNRIDQALALLAVPQPSPVIQLARASLLLQIGRVGEFTRTLQPLLQGSHAGLAHGLNAIAAVARNDIDRARASADEAVEQAPDKAAAWIALSYAQQAQLQLLDALKSARQAVRVQPDSVLAHLRLSELYLAQGDVGAARKTLEAVPEQLARNAELEGSKGFVQLFRLKLTSAREHFTRALAADSSNPQYHLGLGLTLLRDGDLEAGRQQMEYAVSLDPLRSVLRSYLGRAYFEEKRDGEAIKQWDLAKQFDPNDPTPYFYTGVHKLFANDPVGAIDELETSRELNDKRAIYRSETLLQSDAASRSATLARAYNEVGYSQGVLLNGWDAIRRDPTSSEGHRLLADYYAGDPRYETARVSELLQSQLWQPLSAYPLQPQLSEADLSIVAGAGPQRPSFNEYHSLFTQDGVYGMANGYGGSDGTWGDDLVGSFLAGPVAVSLGQYHFESDGWRENADQEQDIYNGLVQWQVSSATSVQFESRKLKWDRGDVSPHYSELVSNIAGIKTDQNTERLGVLHMFSPRSSVVLSVVKQVADDDVTRDLDAINAQRTSKDDWSAELQVQNRYKYGNMLFGAGFWDVENELSDIQQESFVDPDDDSIYYVLDYSLHRLQQPKQFNAYAYLLLNVTDELYLDFGLAYDHLVQEVKGSSNDAFSGYLIDGTLLFLEELNVGPYRVESDFTQWSPKLGVRFDISDSWLLRAAAYRTLQRYLVSGMTVEPTVVSGFVQKYADPLGADSKNYAIAMDYGSARELSAGISHIFRDITAPLFLGDLSGFGSVYYTESFSDAFISYLWSNNVSVEGGISYTARDVERGFRLGSQISELRQYSLPITLLKYFSCGVSVGFQQTYFDQSIKQNPSSPALDKDGWTSDIFLRYRFPGRIGYLEGGVKNIMDEDDEFVSYDGSLLAYYPSRFGYVNVNLNF